MLRQLKEENLMHEATATVFAVDDDDAVRESLRWLIESAGMEVETYGSADDFLSGADWDRAGCLVLDVRMPGTDGLALQQQLRERQIGLPVIIITGHADVPMAIKAMKNGAVDFIEKPFNDELLLRSIRGALDWNTKDRTRKARRDEVLVRMRRLTPREREVAALVVQGLSNKQIASELGVVPKTVEVHRASVMRKMEADTLADLVRKRLLATEPPGPN